MAKVTTDDWKTDDRRLGWYNYPAYMTDRNRGEVYETKKGIYYYHTWHDRECSLIGDDFLGLLDAVNDILENGVAESEGELIELQKRLKKQLKVD